jgi:hypothetical protein
VNVACRERARGIHGRDDVVDVIVCVLHVFSCLSFHGKARFLFMIWAPKCTGGGLPQTGFFNS